MTGGAAVDHVRLLGYPVQLGLALTEHVEECLREFKLIAYGLEAKPSGGADVPERLRHLVDQLRSRYATELSEQDRLRATAAARGDATVDLSYPVADETLTIVGAWEDMLREVDGFCASAELLTLQRSPDQVRLGEWMFGEFRRQLAGEPPTPWERYARLRPVPTAAASNAAIADPGARDEAARGTAGSAEFAAQG